ncbi:hypothetical protein O181_017011 [Austropuccinia psidii MF-1]|uniref:Reverse transcriptase domain-containing protein n=1 Tax=Austropuccinia psidii MF-1 TaxID=1389203 RepID=A0A9Q3GRL0_9BASI|nr:hypothetical protein [Austropuccinia psidii MF-1]
MISSTILILSGLEKLTDHYDSSHKDASGIKSSASNSLATAVNNVALVGELKTPPFHHAISVITSIKRLVGHGSSSLEEQLDEEEDPEEIETVLKIVPPAYHQYLDVFSRVKAEKLTPHYACDHHIELEGLLPPVGVIYSLSYQEKNRYPVPPMNQLLTVFNGATIFPKIDLRGAYNLLRIKEGDENLASFRAKCGSYEYLVMPFGLTNAPASFHNLVNNIFSDFLAIFVVVYLDDIMVFSSSEEEHVKHVASVLQRLRENNSFAKASKCVFHASSVEYLGYVISSDGLKIDSSKFQQILNWPQPKNIKALQSSLSFANFYHRFIKNYSKKITALTYLLKKDSPFIFNEEALSQFQILKEAFTSVPILSHFNPSLPAIVETDASDYALGAILSQVNDSGKPPIAFDTGKLLPAELNYAIHDKELLGIVWALKRRRAFLLSLSNPFEVLTEHSSLQYFMSSKILTCCQAHALSRWDDVYQERGVEFISKKPPNFYQLIKKDGVQESRLFSIKVELFSDLVDQIQREVWKDKDYKEIIKQLARGESVSNYSLEPQGKLLLFRDRVVAPSNEEIQLNMLQKRHDSPLAGHTGQEKTLKLIKRDSS